MTRTRLELKLLSLFLSSVEKVLKDAKMDKAAVNEIVLVGGSTRIPKIQKSVFPLAFAFLVARFY